MHSLKAVLHKGNVLPSIQKKEPYENTKEILSCMNYKTYQWHICGDLKAVAIFLRLQKGYTKFCCVLCEWASHA
jgi:hypothetical protein